MRSLLMALLMAGPVFGCPCKNTGTPCSAMSGNAVVFVGRVLSDSQPTRVAIEERLYNVPKEVRELKIDMAGFPLESDERYVIFAGRDEEDNLVVVPCSETFKLAGNEHVLDALRNHAAGGASRLIGTVRRMSGNESDMGVVPGAIVTADSGRGTYQVMTDAAGNFEIRELDEGAYEVRVAKDGLILERLTATASLGAKSCELLLLDMWPSGRISGTVFDSREKRLEGVVVQVLAAETLDVLRMATTDSQGRYVLEPLPGGKYVVGVNAAPSTDEGPYPPTKREDVQIADGEQADGINITLPQARTAAKLRVYVTGLRGEPYTGAQVNLASENGIQRWYSADQTTMSGWLEAPVYVGEQYVVNAWKEDSSASGPTILFGSARIDITGDNLLLTVTLDHRHSRVE